MEKNKKVSLAIIIIVIILIIFLIGCVYMSTNVMDVLMQKDDKQVINNSDILIQ